VVLPTATKRAICQEAIKQIGIAGTRETGSLEKMRSDRHGGKTSDGDFTKGIIIVIAIKEKRY
jgi:hypothetical protein